MVWREDTPPSRARNTVYVLHQDFATNETLDTLPEQSVILMERIDSAQLWTRHAAEHPAVRLCAKPSVLEADRLALPYTRDHVRALGHDCEAERTLPAISAGAVAKVKPGPSYATYNRMSRIGRYPINLDTPRKIDASFVGSALRGWEPSGEHRRQLVETLSSMGRFNVVAHGEKTLPQDEYDKIALQSKVVVSPWGYGECCHRDFEAFAFGAVLVKPYSDHVLTEPRAFVAGETYEPCRPDWSDLEEVIGRIVDNWDRYRSMRERMLRICRDAYKPEQVAGWVARAVGGAA